MEVDAPPPPPNGDNAVPAVNVIPATPFGTQSSTATESESQPEGPTGLLAAPLPAAPDAGGGQDSTMHTTEPPADDDTADDRRDAGAVP